MKALSHPRQSNSAHPLSLIAGAMIALSTLSATAPAVADEMRIPVMQQGSDKQAIKLPAHGETKAQVQSRYGKPQGIKGPTGEPPITQWFFPDFVVYFESDRVIHAVLKPNR
ncbi:hypothetical protein ACTXGQ_00705 [Marinobacter sp. 1Y8]